LAEYSAPVQVGDEVVVRGTSLGEPLIVELVRAVLERDGIPYVRMVPPHLDEVFFRYASDRVLDTLPEMRMMEYERVDVVFSVLSESNTRALSNVDPAKQVRLQKTLQPLSETYMKRAAEGDFKWCLTLFPTPAFAQDAEMGLLEYTEFVFDACFLNEEDPIGRWQQLAKRQQKLVDHLDTGQEIHIKGPGTDLRLGIAGRTWINSEGTNNFPSGEVFTGPVEKEVDGYISFKFPAVYGGREVRGVRLEFEQGRVVKATAEHNEAFLQEMLDTDEGSRFLGEVAFGTNYNIQRFMRETLFDEKIGGTMHIALGRSYPETGGKNISAIHWDMVCDLREDGEVYVDGELFQKNGRFMILEGGIV
jgi:aminopeptidase